MKLKMALLIAVTAIAPTWAWAAYSADLYVSTTGNDSSSGTSIAPFRTIQRAASLAKPGTIVHVAPGTYNGNIRSTVNGTAAERIRYVSETKWGAKIVGTGTEYHWDNRGSYVDIVGFDVSGPGRGGILNMGSHTLIANNHVHDLKISGGCTGSGGAGIVNGNYAATDGDIIGNVVHDVGVPGSCNGVQGIYHSVLRGRIANNISYRNASFGIHLWHAANETTIVNNTVFNNGSSSIGGGIIVGRGDTGVGVMNNTHILNNIVFNNPNSGISQYCYSGFACIGSGNTVANNLVFGSRTAIAMRVGSPTGTVSADPQFVNYQANGSGDYHLKSTSPAINKGTSNLAPTTDLDGKARQGAYDIGAYEYVSASPAPVPAPTPTPTPVPSAPKVSVSALKVAPGQVITVSVSGIEKGVYAWAALYLASNPDSAWSYQGNWMTMNGTKTAPTSPMASATLKFIAPKDVGVYNIRLFANDGYANRIAISANFTVAAVVPVPAPTPPPSAPIISLSASSLVFPSQLVGSASAVQILTIKNSGTAALKFPSSFVMSGDFAFGGKGTCKVNVSYAPGASCTASVVFKPKAKGTRSGSLSIRSNASATRVIVNLTGTGL
ncbi:MAG: choice-of-anchor D domain-containing protein [Pseudobdellovibrionaceae bacterium]